MYLNSGILLSVQFYWDDLCSDSETRNLQVVSSWALLDKLCPEWLANVLLQLQTHTVCPKKKKISTQTMSWSWRVWKLKCASKHKHDMLENLKLVCRLQRLLQPFKSCSCSRTASTLLWNCRLLNTTLSWHTVPNLWGAPPMVAMDVTASLAAFDQQQQQQQQPLAGMIQQPLSSLALPLQMAQLQQQVGGLLVMLQLERDWHFTAGPL